MTVDRSPAHTIWLTEMYMGNGKPDEAGWKLWHQSYPFDTYVALREWHRYQPPYFPWPNGESNNDHNIYWTEEDGNNKVYWRAQETQVMNVQSTLSESVDNDDKHLTDVSQKMRQHVVKYRNQRRSQLGIGKSNLNRFAHDLDQFIKKYETEQDSDQIKEIISNLTDYQVDILNALGEEELD